MFVLSSLTQSSSQIYFVSRHISSSLYNIKVIKAFKYAYFRYRATVTLWNVSFVALHAQIETDRFVKKLCVVEWPLYKRIFKSKLHTCFIIIMQIWRRTASFSIKKDDTQDVCKFLLVSIFNEISIKLVSYWLIHRSNVQCHKWLIIRYLV